MEYQIILLLLFDEYLFERKQVLMLWKYLLNYPTFFFPVDLLGKMCLVPNKDVGCINAVANIVFYQFILCATGNKDRYFQF